MCGLRSTTDRGELSMSSNVAIWIQAGADWSGNTFDIVVCEDRTVARLVYLQLRGEGVIDKRMQPTTANTLKYDVTVDAADPKYFCVYYSGLSEKHLWIWPDSIDDEEFIDLLEIPK